MDPTTAARMCDFYRMVGEPPAPFYNYALAVVGATATWVPCGVAHVAAGNEPSLQVIPAYQLIDQVNRALDVMQNVQASAPPTLSATASCTPLRPRTAIPMPIDPRTITSQLCQLTLCRSQDNPHAVLIFQPPSSTRPATASGSVTRAAAGQPRTLSTTSQSISTAASDRFQEIVDEAQDRVQRGTKKLSRFTSVKLGKVVQFRDGRKIETAAFEYNLCGLSSPYTLIPRTAILDTICFRLTGSCCSLSEVTGRSHFVRHVLHECKDLPTDEADTAELVKQRNAKKDSQEQPGSDEVIRWQEALSKSCCAMSTRHAGLRQSPCGSDSK